MKVRDIQRVIEAWAPREIAWERDNAGLQCGDPDMRVNGILVALDPTEEVVTEAREKRANLIVTHHPLLFRPLHSVTPGSEEGRCLSALIRHRIAMFSAHTNLDFTRGGTSFALAEVLGLTEIEFLHRPYRVLKKIVTYVPISHAERVANAMADAGAGVIGNYDHCSFRTEGTGTYRGNDASNPRLGKKGILEQVREVRVEMAAPSWSVEDVIAAMRAAHPYEEVAYEVYPTENRSTDFGMGVIGNLPKPTTLGAFLGTIKRTLRAEGLRYAGNPRMQLRRIAVCGGSGSDLIAEAARRGAGVFVTADIKYHGFHQATPRMALVDAGHYETEFPVVSALVDRIASAVRSSGDRIAVHPARRSTNPVHFL